MVLFLLRLTVFNGLAMNVRYVRNVKPKKMSRNCLFVTVATKLSITVVFNLPKKMSFINFRFLKDLGIAIIV